MLDPVDSNPNFVTIEKEVLEFWRASDIARRSIEKEAPNGPFVFYEGPPTANGRPGIHHVSARAFKDVILRFRTMRGYYVQRRHGWDTHGLPVEVEIEKEIGSTGKRDIEIFGVENFNARCKESVFRYIQDWNALTERIAFWLDLKDGYITYTNDFMETCWWILKSLWERGLLIEDFKTTMHCPRCNSTLASHEVSQGMTEDVDDPSVWPKFRLRESNGALRAIAGDRPVVILSWTTTPWTLPANAALAVSAKASYALVEGPKRHECGDGDLEVYLVAEARVEATFADRPHRVLGTIGASHLVGLGYEPLFDCQRLAPLNGGRAWRVIADDSVVVDDGTGVVHIAPAYGDLAIGRAHDLPILHSVDLNGEVVAEVKPRFSTGKGYAGSFFKVADEAISADLVEAGLMYRHERIRHAYPLCWRDDTPLLFYAKSSWYLRTTAVRDEMLANNLAINWVPEHVKNGRFGKWLEGNVDWAISRERFWGTALPIWETADGTKRICVGSVSELSGLVGRDLSGLDLHRPYVDEIAFEHAGETYRRVPYTIDVWFESGAMPYAQWHYPFENQELFHRNFPADFICEAMDQTRGWFYSLHALASLLTDTGDGKRPPGVLADQYPPSPAFRNCIVIGFINDSQGRKMSKSRGNAVDPWSVLDNQGADALRWYLYSSGQPDQNKNFDVRHVSEALRGFYTTLWNCYSFFVTYARLDRPDLAAEVPLAERPRIDRWQVARLQQLIAGVTERLDAFDPAHACRLISDFVNDDFSNWYLRINRRRFWKSNEPADKLAAYKTAYETLATVVHLMAPMSPLISEAIYRNLVKSWERGANDSVHLSEWPTGDDRLVDEQLLEDMAVARSVIELGRSARSESQLGVRQPLSEIQVRLSSEAEEAALRRTEDLVLRELNIKRLTILPRETQLVRFVLRPNYRLLGRRIGARVSLVAKALEDLGMEEMQAAAERVGAGQALALDLGNDGERIEIEAEAFQIEIRGLEGQVTVEKGGTLVALKTALDNELIQEGRARNLVRLVQNARKEAGLEVQTRIDLGLELSAELEAAVEAHREYLMAEVLAESLVFGRLDEAFRTHVELHDTEIAVNIRPCH